MLKRYGMFIAGVIFSVLKINLITKAGLGTSLITSLALVLIFILPHSLRVFTMMVDPVISIIQVVPLGKSLQKIQPPQLPAALLFSVCIGGWLCLLSYWQTGEYVGEILVLLLGCAFLGLGVALEVIPNVLIPSGEGLVHVIADLTGWKLGHVKTGFDMSIMASAVVVSVLVKGQMLGIRGGIVIAALIIGNTSHFFIEKVSAALIGWIPDHSEATDAMIS